MNEASVPRLAGTVTNWLAQLIDELCGDPADPNTDTAAAAVRTTVTAATRTRRGSEIAITSPLPKSGPPFQSSLRASFALDRLITPLSVSSGRTTLEQVTRR